MIKHHLDPSIDDPMGLYLMVAVKTLQSPMCHRLRWLRRPTIAAHRADARGTAEPLRGRWRPSI